MSHKGITCASAQTGSQSVALAGTEEDSCEGAPVVVWLRWLLLWCKGGFCGVLVVVWSCGCGEYGCVVVWL